MRLVSTETDPVVLQQLGERMAAVRLERNWTQQQLADQAGISKRTVERLEAGKATHLPAFIRVLRALGLLERLDALIPQPTVSPIAQLKLQRAKRQRATGRKSTQTTGKRWTWGDQ